MQVIVNGQQDRWWRRAERPRGVAGAVRAFTIIELMVVIGLIILILAIAIPSLETMSRDNRLNQAVQTTSGAITRAYYAALANHTLVAVRFLPGEWDLDPEADPAQQTQGRMHLAIYNYVPTSSADPRDLRVVKFDEYFQRQAGVASVTLPEDMWAAPLEAVDDDQRAILMANAAGGTPHLQPSNYRDFLLRGASGAFDLDAAAATELRRADDFLLVLDPNAGLQSVSRPWRLKAYVPKDTGFTSQGTEAASADDRVETAEPYRRYNFSGLTFYPRGGLPKEANQQAARWHYLQQTGQAYLVHRFGGGLIAGKQEKPR